MSDPRAVRARETNRLAGEHVRQAQQYREIRDDMIRRLRREDPVRWTYSALAAAAEISPELAAAIVKGRTGRLRAERMESE